jgi:hypothetical protein
MASSARRGAVRAHRRADPPWRACEHTALDTEFWPPRMRGVEAAIMQEGYGSRSRCSLRSSCPPPWCCSRHSRPASRCSPSRPDPQIFPDLADPQPRSEATFGRAPRTKSPSSRRRASPNSLPLDRARDHVLTVLVQLGAEVDGIEISLDFHTPRPRCHQGRPQTLSHISSDSNLFAFPPQPP